MRQAWDPVLRSNWNLLNSLLVELSVWWAATLAVGHVDCCLLVEVQPFDVQIN